MAYVSVTLYVVLLVPVGVTSCCHLYFQVLLQCSFWRESMCVFSDL